MMTLQAHRFEPIGGMGSCSITGSDPQSPKAKLTVRPTVSKIQYQRDNDWFDTTNPLYVLKDQQLTFKASPNPGNATWPSGTPTWSGSAGASGNGATKAITFSNVSSSTNDFKTIVASNGNSVTVNVIVFELTRVFTPANDFAARSYERFGVEEDITLGFTASPTVTAAQAGGLRWGIGTAGSGNGTINSLDNGTGSYTAPDTAKSITLNLKILDGPCKDQGLPVNISIVDPSGAYISARSGTKHFQYTWSTGFIGDVHLEPSDVSFFNRGFYEGATPMHSSGWLSALNDFHPQTANPIPPINSQNIVNVPDLIFTGSKGPPYGVGNWYWDIEWHVKLSSGRDINLGVFRELATSDANGKAVITKGGASRASNENDPSSSW